MATALFNSSRSSMNGYGDKLICDCGQKCYTQIELNDHKSNNCKNRMLQCSFCQESQPSSRQLSEHLMMCGNKTDQCPNCRKFIRRAIFAYHYENNCANLDESDTPTTQSRNSSAHRPSSKTSQSAAPKEHNPIDNDRENNYGDTSVDDQSDKIQRISSATSSHKNPTDIKDCKYCKQKCERSEYRAHKKNCLQNPRNINKKQQQNSFISDNTESRSAKDIVRIPCEFCNEEIDFSLWSAHTKDCQERENRRIQTRAETISREPVTEKVPCQYCEELHSIHGLEVHERFCWKNPEWIPPTTRFANTRPSTTVDPSNALLNTRRDPSSSSTYSSLRSSYVSAYNRSPRAPDILNQIRDQENNNTLQNERFSSHVTVHMNSNQERSRPRDNDLSNISIARYQPSQQNRTRDDASSVLTNSSYDVPAYGTSSLLSNNRPFSGTQSLPRTFQRASPVGRSYVEKPPEKPRPVPPLQVESLSSHTLSSQSASKISFDSRGSLRSHSASRSYLDERGSHRPQSTKAINHLANHDTIFHSHRQVDQGYQPRINERERPRTIASKPPRSQPLPNQKPLWRH